MTAELTQEELNERLISAAEKGNLEAVKQYVQAGADIHANDDDPVGFAAMNDDILVVEWLLENGADKNRALKWAVYNGKHTMAAYLLEKGANPQVAIYDAIEAGKLPILKWLVDKGARLTTKDALSAVENDQLEVLQWLVENGADIDITKVAEEAAGHNYLEMVKCLVERGADKDAAFNESILYGSLQVAKWLYTQGVSYDLEESSSLEAMEYGYLETVQWLHEKGIYFNPQKGLLKSAEEGQLEMTAYLLEIGADISGKNEALSTKSFSVAALLQAAPQIEKTITEWQENGPPVQKKDIRKLFYTAAYMASHITQDAEKLHAQMLSIANKTIDDIVIDPKKHSAVVDVSLQEKLSALDFSYLELGNTMDAVNAYVETVLLGQWLLDSGREADEIDESETRKIAKELRQIAAEILYGNRGLLGIIRYSDAWHNHPLPDDMRPLRAGQWHPLIEPHISPHTSNIGTEEHPQMEKITIVALCSHQELKKETEALKHCVGDGDYGTRCKAGEIHILSLQAGGGR